MGPWKDLFNESNINLLKSIIGTIDMSGQNIRPKKDEVLEIFCRIDPEMIRAVIVGQSPYPNDEACGIPFISKKGNITRSLGILKQEIEMEYDTHIDDPNSMIEMWINQGVFIINGSLTIGISGKSYLRDHSIMWKEFVIEVMRYLGKKSIPIMLFGKEAWTFEDYITKSYIIKVPHPVSRGDNKFLGCNVFFTSDKYIERVGSKKISWCF